MNNQHLYSDENLNSDLILKEIKISFLKEDINSKYADKQIFLYDSPELKEISSTAIVTPKYIFIDSDHFTELSTYYNGQPHRKNKEFIKDIVDNRNNNTYVVMSDDKIISTLKESGYDRVVNLLTTDPENMIINNFNKKDKEFALNFNEKFSNFIKQYFAITKNDKPIQSIDKNLNINKKYPNSESSDFLKRFILNNCKELQSLSDICFGLTVHNFNSENYLKKYNIYVDNNFTKQAAMIFYNEGMLTQERRKLLVNEASGYNDFSSFCLRKSNIKEVDNKPKIK